MLRSTSRALFPSSPSSLLYPSRIFFPSECSPPHRTQHSFPTRRSSDLQGFAESHVDRSFHLPDHRGGIEDRKSTRLNSSHLGISYAVFCLKKKNIKETEVVI